MGTAADISSLKTIGIQDIHLTGNLLTIDKNLTSTGVDLSKYIDNTDNQNLSFDPATNTLSIERGSSVVLGSTVAFRAKKAVAETGLSGTDHDFIAPIIEYNDGGAYNGSNGIFTAPVGGIYSFTVGFNASSLDDSKALKILLNNVLYETFISDITIRSSFTKSITMKLVTGDRVKITINPGYSTESGTGSISGYKVY